LKQGWTDIGYHYVIRRDSAVDMGRPVRLIGAHASGYNTGSIAICLVGGLDKDGKPEDNFTLGQKRTLSRLLINLFTYLGGPVEVLGHRDLPGVKKDCPCFDVKKWMEEFNEINAPRIQPL
jgi:N-acetylmuramoyl-L-alanine amidase